MPRGVPKAGYRRPKGSRKIDMARIAASIPQVERIVPRSDVETDETEDVIEKRINDRFETLQFLTRGCLNGDLRSEIVSGPPGLGKSFTVETELERWDPSGEKYRISKGYIRATGLYKLLYQYRFQGQILVFDDIDSIFFDETALNFIKAAVDTLDKRVLSYLAETVLIDDDTGEAIPNRFEYEGQIIFITNYDFDYMIASGSKLSPHLEALSSRSHYIDLMMKNRRDYIVRIKQVIAQGLLDNFEFQQKDVDEIIEYIESNAKQLRELSLRLAIKLGQIKNLTPKEWKKIADSTLLRVR